jgi:hypothetical protein
MSRAAALLGLLIAGNAAAAPWQFAPPVDVVAPREGVFPHLDGAGRAHLVVSRGAVALAWEDNRSGSPQVHVAVKRDGARVFDAPRQASNGREAYEPAIAALADGSFVVAYEQDGALWARVIDARDAGAALKLADRAAQVSIAPSREGRLYAAWSQREEDGVYIRLAEIEVQDGDGLAVRQPARRIDREAGRGEQYYPSLAVSEGGVTVGWEDRRRGHTVILTAHARDGRRFAPPRPLNELPARSAAQYGKGTGAARVVLRAAAQGEVLAVWLDKRDFVSGYDIYSAHSGDGGASFGANRKIHDEFGQYAAQWHVSLASGGGQVVAVWDDDRDETPDVFLAWRVADGWSDNLAVPGATGAGEQVSPVITLDDAGNLHLVWIERGGESAASSLRYLYGRRHP